MSLILISCLVSSTTGCDRETIKGQGNSKQEIRSVKSFSGIDVNGDFLINGSLGNPVELIISSNPNILPHINSRVDNDILTVQNDDSYNLQPSVQQNMWFTTNNFKTLHLSGNTQFEMYNLEGNQLDCILKGTHVVLLKGKLTYFKMVIHGNANVNAKDLHVTNADIEINGSAVVGLSVTTNLKVKINGEGKVLYYEGQPKVEQNISGYGEIGSGFGPIGQQPKKSNNQP